MLLNYFFRTGIFFKIIFSFVVVAFIQSSAVASEFQLGSLTIKDPWSRATSSHQMSGVVYVKIINSGNDADRLIKVESNRSKKATLHDMILDGDIIKMHSIKNGIEIPANSEVELEPGAKHIMLMGLKTKLDRGQTVGIALHFQHAGLIEIKALVFGAGSRGPKRENIKGGLQGDQRKNAHRNH